MNNLALNNTSSVVLPFILQTLSQKPQMCDTYENLCDEIKHILSKENLTAGYGNTEKNIKNALDIGKNLGILVITNDLIRMPFKYNKSSKAPQGLKKNSVARPSNLRRSVQKATATAVYPRKKLWTRLLREYTVRPTVVARGRPRSNARGRSRSRGSRRSSRSRRR